ncbi:hypothetical protein P8C59_003530 [Phyllachora maydis]|uniref:GAG-pre-integrase domain-containing protein n=1 Tax=Phyllachora maydis TaxID=1825666 RepID=A0AAD9I0K7_9PEZI|nr:hypothetical protein P8C59_003530 [Phyllachora maydis]
MADILEESRNPATEVYRAAHIANSSNSTPNSNSNPSKKESDHSTVEQATAPQPNLAYVESSASFMLGSYNLAIEEEEESDSSSNSSSSSDSNTQLAQLLALKGYKKRKDFKGKGLKTSSNKAKYKDNQPRRRPRDPALYNSWLYDTGSTDHISNSKERFTTFTPNTGQLRPINTGNGPVSPASIGSITLEVLSRKAPPTYTKLVLDNVLYLPNININIISGVRHYDSGGCLIKETLYGGDRRCIAVLDFKKSGFFLDVKGSSKPILHANFAFPLGLTSYNTTKSIEPQRNKIVVEIPSNSIRKEDYRPIIEDAIVSEAIEPNKRYKLRNSPAKGTTLEGVGPSLRGKRPRRPTREPEPLTSTGDLPRVLREPVIEGNKVVEKAISSPTLKEPNIGQRDYYNLLNLAKLWHVRLGHIGLRLLKKTSSITKGLPNFDKIKEADFHCSSCDRGKAVRRVSKALIPDPPRVLDLIEGDTVKIRPRPYNRNPIVLLLVDRKSRYRWVFNLPNKSGPIVAVTEHDSLSNLDDLVYDILALAPILAKPAKITPAIRRAAARKAKQRELAKACTIAGRAAAAKRRKKPDKDDNNTYNRAYVPPTNVEEEEEEEEEDSSGNNNDVNSGTSNSTNKGKGSSVYKRSKGALRCKDMPLCK